MRRARFWILIGAAALVVLIAVLLLALPSIVRRTAISQLRAMTGREVAITDVRLNLFTRKLSVAGFRVDEGGGAPALLELERLDARFRLFPLLRGRFYFETLQLTSPKLRIARLANGDLNIAELIERFSKGPPREEPLALTLERFGLTGGAVVFDDEAVSPPRRFEVKGLAVELRDITTVTDREAGTASARFTLAGAPATVTADQIRARPAHARATITVTDLDLPQFWAYVPSDAAVRPDRGRFTTRIDLRYNAADGLRSSSETTVSDLALWRRGQSEPLVTTPLLTVSSKDVVYRDGVFTAGRLEVTGEPSILDASVTPPQRYDLRAVRLVTENISYPTRAPGRVHLTAGLPAGGALDAQGSLGVAPLDAKLQLAVKDVDLSLLRPYFPETSPVSVGGGRLGGALALSYGTGAVLGLSGDLTAADLVLLRRGQAEPFSRHKQLQTTITDLTWQSGRLGVRRVGVSGAPTIVDASVSPPQRFELSKLSLVAENATWPAERAANVQLDAALGGSGAVTVTGTLNPATLETNLRATLTDLDVTRATAYVPPDAAVRVTRGRVRAALALRHDKAAGTRVTGDGAVTDVALARRGEREPFLTDRALGFTITDLVTKDGALTVRGATVTSTPVVLDGTVSPPRQLSFRSLRLTASDVAWPATRPTRVQVLAELPEAGTLAAAGTIAAASRAVEATIELKDAALGPFQRFLAIAAPLGGRADAALKVSGVVSEPPRITIAGTASLQTVVIGPAERPAVTVERVDVAGVEVRWPTTVHIPRVVISKPVAVVEREQDGSFPLRAMLTPRSPEAPEITAAASPRTEASDAPADSRTIRIDELLVEDGDVRFVDRTTTPFYSEEISKLAITIRGFTTAPDGRAEVTVQGVVGTAGVLDLRGEVAPFGKPFFLELAGELRDFAIPRTNPFMRKYLDWVARRGQLTTKVHYRIIGDQLEATNDILVQRLDVERARPGVDADRKVGLPLGLAVSLLKDSRGDIHLTVPVGGRLSAPEFSFGSVIASAIRNVIGRLATAPFRAIGKVFQKEDEVEELKIDPVVFQPGNAVLTPEAERHLQRVADFLREAPYIGLTLRPVASGADLLNLRTQEVTARIQRVQRERGLTEFAEAARQVFVEQFPNQPVPATPEEIVQRLRDREPPPEQGARQLAARRIEVVRQTLIERAGVEPERVSTTEGPPPGASGDGRVEFELSS